MIRDHGFKTGSSSNRISAAVTLKPPIGGQNGITQNSQDSYKYSRGNGVNATEIWKRTENYPYYLKLTLKKKKFVYVRLFSERAWIVQRDWRRTQNVVI